MLFDFSLLLLLIARTDAQGLRAERRSRANSSYSPAEAASAPASGQAATGQESSVLLFFECVPARFP